YALEFGFTDEMLLHLRKFVETLNDFDDQLRAHHNVELAMGGFEPEIVAMPAWENIRRDAGALMDSAVDWFERYGLDEYMLEWSRGGKTFGRPGP
ncbi:MAG TPA: hypothetical protein VGF18_00265, partial [Candidatus Tumulicola sp.]